MAARKNLSDDGLSIHTICLFMLCIALGILPSASSGQIPRLRLRVVTTGLTRPTDIAVINDTTLLIAQTDGKIQLIRRGVIQSTPFLDLSSQINDPTWEGIFGMTLHPDFAQNGYLYVHYCRKTDGASVFARFTRSIANPAYAELSSEAIILVVPYQGGHRSGRIGFGPDGYLYITTGDSCPGGRGMIGDPDKLAQNPQLPYGKLFRIDVNQGMPYVIPPTNPFADPADGIPDELYALGLRNPWRWSFDRETGDFWLADVGQDGWEELNITLAGTPAPQNYGWPCFEGTHPYHVDCSEQQTYHMPLLDYAGYNGGNSASITGGFVYRGTRYADLWGWYVYADYVRGTYWTLKRNTDGSFQQIVQTLPINTTPVSFGESPDGELFVVSLLNGTVYQLSTESIASIQSGRWHNPQTWNCLCLPSANDSVTISTNHEVVIDQPTQAKSVRLLGNLQFLNPQSQLIVSQ